MSIKLFRICITIVGIVFTVIFGVVVVPPLIDNPDIIGAFSAGFVNPYASGYSADVITCWFILLIWIVYESPKVKYGWLCLLLGLMPGVAVGFALYLLIRLNQLPRETNEAATRE